METVVGASEICEVPGGGGGARDHICPHRPSLFTCLPRVTATSRTHGSGHPVGPGASHWATEQQLERVERAGELLEPPRCCPGKPDEAQVLNLRGTEERCPGHL